MTPAGGALTPCITSGNISGGKSGGYPSSHDYREHGGGGSKETSKHDSVMWGEVVGLCTRYISVTVRAQGSERWGLNQRGSAAESQGGGGI